MFWSRAKSIRRFLLLLLRCLAKMETVSCCNLVPVSFLDVLSAIYCCCFDVDPYFWRRVSQWSRCVSSERAFLWSESFQIDLTHLFKLPCLLRSFAPRHQGSLLNNPDLSMPCALLVRQPDIVSSEFRTYTMLSMWQLSHHKVKGLQFGTLHWPQTLDMPKSAANICINFF